MLTQKRVRELFDYDPETGDLTRRVASKGYHGDRLITRRNDSGYLITTVDGKTYRVHHLVWLYHHGSLPATELDHINRIKDDNRIENIRMCSRVENCGNSAARVHRYKGVSWDKVNNKWKAQLGVNRKNKNLGRFSTIEEAALAYNAAAIEHFGEFAFLNEVTE